MRFMVRFLISMYMLGIMVSFASASTLEINLKSHVRVLAQDIGERNFQRYENLEKAAEYIFFQLKAYGYMPVRQVYTVEGKKFSNIIARKSSAASDETVVIGAHYDSAEGTPGADDNASGVAMLLELARYFVNREVKVNIEFVAFTNEEPPFFATESMGSKVYANEKKKNNENIKGMICLEMVGCFTEAKNSQSYPTWLLKPFYPSKGNYVAFVSNFNSRKFKNQLAKAFKRNSELPVRTLSAPSFVTGVDFSDHRCFWENGYKAVMVTDTAFYRNRNYHKATDTINTLDLDKMTKVYQGLEKAIESLAN